MLWPLDQNTQAKLQSLSRIIVHGDLIERIKASNQAMRMLEELGKCEPGVHPCLNAICRELHEQQSEVTVPIELLVERRSGVDRRSGIDRRAH